MFGAYGVGVFHQTHPANSGPLRFPRVQTANYRRWPNGLPAGQYGDCLACAGVGEYESAFEGWKKYALLGLGAYLLLKIVL